MFILSIFDKFGEKNQIEINDYYLVQKFVIEV